MSEQYEAGRCVIGEKVHRADVGFLCDRHLNGLARMLREVEDEAIQLEIRPSMAVGYDDKASGGLASHKAPARIDAVVLRDPRRGTGIPLSGEPDLWGWDDTPSVLDVLASWARVVREERDLSAPDQVTVMSERGVLSRQMTWIAEQPWADELYDEIRKLLRTLQRVNNTLELPVGRCESLQPNGSLCEGNVWHTEIQHETGPAEPGFRCSRCRRVWTGTEAVRLRDRMWRDEQERKATA